MKALLNHAVKRQLIPTSPLTEKICFEDVPLPELELNDEERLAFLGAFDNHPGFKDDVASRRRDAHAVSSGHFKTPRRFGFGPNPDSESTTKRFERFRSLKPIFVVAIETGVRKMDLLNLEWTQVDLDGGFIRLLMKKTRKWAVVPISQLCRQALEECRARRVMVTCSSTTAELASRTSHFGARFFVRSGSRGSRAVSDFTTFGTPQHAHLHLQAFHCR